MHPLLLAFALAALGRAVVVVGLHLHLRASGLIEPPLSLLAHAGMHAGVTLGWGALAAWLARVLGARAGALLAMGMLVALGVWTCADPIVYALSGDHLTLSLLGHFAGPRIFTSDYLWKPIAASPLLSFGGLASLVGVVVLALRSARPWMRAEPPFVRSCAAISALAVALVSTALLFDLRGVDLPPEVCFAADALAVGRTLDERDVAQLRAFVGLPEGARWLDDRFPLVYAPAAGDAPSVQPDLVLINIESLRGGDLRWVHSGAPTAHTRGIALPELERLAHDAVVFPRFVANGFPSTEGFIATSASAWPHDRRRIVIDFKRTRFDLLASRLASLGYRTLKVEDDPDLDEEGFWVRRAFTDHITSREQHEYPSEQAMVAAIERWLSEHDRQRAGQPVLIDWKTAHPHMPYEVPNDVARQDELRGGSARASYPHALRYVDGAISRLVAFLRARPRFAHTILVVLGDHGNVLSPAETSPLPTDDMVWTGALVHGPVSLVGVPRRVLEPASQVDIMPTLLALVGDHRPTAALGRDLLARRPGRPARALSVRPAGLRLEDLDSLLVVDRRQLRGGLHRPAFGSHRASRPSLRGEELARLATTFGLLVERDRIWDARFLR